MEKAKRVLAILGVVLLIGNLAAAGIVVAIGGSKDLLMAFIVLSVLLPVLMYAMILIARVISGKPAKDIIDQARRNEENENRIEDSSSKDSNAQG